MINEVVLLLIETALFVVFNAYLYRFLPDILGYCRVAYYVSHYIIDIIVLAINYLIAAVGIILALFVFREYAVLGYYYAVLTTVTLILFEL
jgi:hypothetical protein